jgi:hypothetical protein
VLAPLAVKVFENPWQVVTEAGEIETAGFGFTVTVTLAVPVHPLVVPDTV